MSVAIYAGSMQFVAIELLTIPFHFLNVLFITLTVNIRHLFYGLSMLDKFKDSGKLKPYMIFSLTDETYSILCSASAPEGVSSKWYFFFIAFLNHCYWIAGSVIGCTAGNLIPFNSEGIDFAMTALFIVIFVEQWKKSFQPSAGHSRSCCNRRLPADFRDRLVYSHIHALSAALFIFIKQQEEGNIMISPALTILTIAVITFLTRLIPFLLFPAN